MMKPCFYQLELKTDLALTPVGPLPPVRSPLLF